MPEISVIIVSYNSAEVLRDCLRSVFANSAESCEVIVVDNASQDQSRALIQAQFPSVRLLPLTANVGFGAACNQAAAIATGTHLAFLNPDTVVEPGWLSPLVHALERDPSVGAVSPKIVLMDNPAVVNACGNAVHVAGFPSCHLWGLPAERVQESAEVASISGAAFLISRTLFHRLGGFDPTFFMYLEDTDLSWRLRLAGYRCRYVPQAVVRHRYAPSFSVQKVFYLERNRYRLLLKNLTTKTLWALLPALLVAELSSWGYSLLRGPRYLAAKWSADLWTLRHWREVRRAHEQVLSLGQTHADRELVRSCSTHIAYEAAYPGRLATIMTLLCDPLYVACRWLAVVLLRVEPLEPLATE